MSFWRRVFGRPPTTPPPVAQPLAAVPPVNAPAGPLLPPPVAQAQNALALLVADAALGRPPDAIAASGHIESLRQGGHERLAIEWLDKLVVALASGRVEPGLAESLTWRSAELRADRGELAEVIDRLIALGRTASWTARAHFLVAEHHRRQGDHRQSLLHLEIVLAVDVHYPNALVRAEALRASLGAAVAPADAGDTIAGVEGGAVRSARYQLVRQLGRGAAGVVYLARDVELDRDVAVKLLHPHLAAARNADARARFFDEARVAAALRHPGIIAIFDLDEPAKRIVMENAAGGTLRSRLMGGPMSVVESVERHVELLAALAAAHARGVVHRDLKPANLLFRGAGGRQSLILTDFGVAHLAGADRRGGGREPVGTLAYMAPEQRRGGDAAPAADLYAAGVILWECLVGRLPWGQDALLRGARSDEDLALPATLEVGRLRHGLGELLLRLGAVDPASRGDAASALSLARSLLDELRHGDELAGWQAEREAFRREFPPR